VFIVVAVIISPMIRIWSVNGPGISVGLNTWLAGVLLAVRVHQGGVEPARGGSSKIEWVSLAPHPSLAVSC
jgi:hypothetical protein